MITFFSIPKSFTNPHINIIQRNAINSWKKIHKDIEIYLFSDDPNIESISKELSVNFINDLKKNENGTPFLDQVFYDIQNIAKNDIICFVNCDIIILQDILNVNEIFKKKDYLLVGQRWDLDERNLIDFDNISLDDYYNSIKNKIKLHPPSGSDYFMFKKGSIDTMPPFLIGRICWDNWMIYNFISKKSCLDSTQSITVIHQNHDYNHTTSKLLDDENIYNENIYNKFSKKKYRFTLENIFFALNKNNKITFNYKYIFGLLRLIKHSIFEILILLKNSIFTNKNQKK